MVWCLGGYWLVFGWPDRWWFGVWVVVVIGDWCLGSRFFLFCWWLLGCVWWWGGDCCWFAREIEKNRRDRDRERKEIEK